MIGDKSKFSIRFLSVKDVKVEVWNRNYSSFMLMKGFMCVKVRPKKFVVLSPWKELKLRTNICTIVAQEEKNWEKTNF